MVKLVYPRYQQELEKKHMNVRQAASKAGLKYSTICPKLTHRGGVTITEGLALKLAVDSRLSLDKLFVLEE